MKITSTENSKTTFTGVRSSQFTKNIYNYVKYCPDLSVEVNILVDTI